MGCRVYANNESLFDILEEERVEAIIVSSEKVHRLETSGMIDRLIAEDIRILTVPPINDLGRQGVQIKDIQIEDLYNGIQYMLISGKYLHTLKGSGL